MKKIIAIFLVSIMMCFSVSANESSYKADNSGLVLEELGFIQSADNSSAVISRAEFADILVKMLNSNVSGSTGYFVDVNETHRYYNSLSAAYSLGIISGGVTRADDSVTYQEAVKMTVCALGYGAKALSLGGYPAGYLMVAASSGITKGVKVSDNSYLARTAAYRMAYNALSVDLMEVRTIGGELRYMVTPDNNVLSKYHSVFKKTGLLEGVNGLCVFQNSDIPEDAVLIDGETYTASRSDLKELVGQNVEFYYNTEKNEILSIQPGNNSILTINAEDIEGFSGMRLRYVDENDNEKYAAISVAANIIYNGVAIEYFDESAFLAGHGKITLIDNLFDGLFDTVIMEITEDYVVKGIDVSNSLIFDMYDSQKKLYMNMSDPDYNINFTDEFGNNMFLEDLQKFDLISVAKSLDGKVINAYFSNSEVIGTVEEVSNLGTELSLKINGKEYTSTAAFAAAEEVKIGDNGVFGLNINQKIASVNWSGSENLTFGFLISGTGGKGLEKESRFKVFADDGKFTILRTADKVTFDGYRVSGKDVYDRIAKSGVFMPQLVCYRLNSEGEISYIDTKDKTAAESGNTLNRYYSAYFTDNDKEKTVETLTYRRSGIFSTSVPTSGKTKVFIVPYDVKDAPEDEFKIKNMYYFEHDMKYGVEAYRTSVESYSADVVVVRPGKSTDQTQGIPSDTAISVIKKITSAIDSRTEESTTKLYLFTGGSEEERLIKNAAALEIPSLGVSGSKHKLGVGDVIRYVADELGRITYIELIYDKAGDNFAYQNNASTTDPIGIARFTRGEVYSQFAGTMAVYKGSIGGSGKVLTQDQLEFYSLGVYNIYVYDSKEDDPVRLGTASDIEDYVTTGSGSKLIMYTRYLSAGAFLIIK